MTKTIAEVYYLFANVANTGEEMRSPTMNADDRTPSSKLLKSKSPLHVKRNLSILNAKNRKRKPHIATGEKFMLLSGSHMDNVDR